jgi:hypothetical protein
MPDKLTKEISAFDLLFRFTALRQTGENRDDAWYRVCDEAPNVSEVTLSAFLTLAKNWERAEGHKYLYRQKPDADSTLNRNPVRESSQEAAQGPTAVTTNQEQNTEAEDSEDLAPSMPRLGPAAQSGDTAQLRHSNDFFDANTILLMYFKTHPYPLRVKIAGNDELFIGRATANAAMSPEIDLNPINAGDYGVSRMHATLTRQNNKLLIADLDSMNSTYINGVRAFPHESYTLRDGDEVWFGQLQCRIRFQHT